MVAAHDTAYVSFANKHETSTNLEIILGEVNEGLIKYTVSRRDQTGHEEYLQDCFAKLALNTYHSSKNLHEYICMFIALLPDHVLMAIVNSKENITFNAFDGSICREVNIKLLLESENEINIAISLEKSLPRLVANLVGGIFSETKYVNRSI
jgi:hypothetical protein